MKTGLTKEEIYFLARVKKINVAELQKLEELFDVQKVRKLFVLYEYRRKVYSKLYTKKQIVELLMHKYDVSRSYIEGIIYSKRKVRRKNCVRCGRDMTALQWLNNGGVCVDCLNK